MTSTRVALRRISPAIGGLLLLGLLGACNGSSSTTATDHSGAPAAAGTASAAALASATDDAVHASPSMDAIDTSPTPSGAGSGPGVASPSVASPGVTRPPATKPVVVLEPDGLGFLVGGSSIRHLTFAQADAASIKTALTAALGTLKANDLPECGQGPRKSLEGDSFSVLLDGTKFVGWVDQGAKAHRSTADGLAIGSTLADVKKSEPTVQVLNDTLGPEFFVEGGVSGLLDGQKSTSKVTVLYAGETCFFR